MRRRDILILLGVVPITPLGAAAQSRLGKTWRIACFYGTPSANESVPAAIVTGAFVQGMRELGHTEGQDFIIDYYAVYDADKPDEAAREMVRRHVDLILALTQSDIVLAAKRATRDIPIVFVVAGDPVANGIVASMSRPGGNVTGLTSLNASADAKRLEILKEAMPALRRVVLLASRGDPGTSSIVSAGSPVFFVLQPRIAQWAGAARTPIISPWRELPLAGGLLSYGTSVSAMFRRAAVFVDRILKGEDHPATFPVEQPTTFELVVNLKTAKALGLTIPPLLLARADKVIE
jgi:putative ABC transport system substrate-binding protein